MNNIEFFKELGFVEYEAKVISCLIKINPLNPKEISKNSGVPQNKLYSILKKFEILGIIEVFVTEPKKYKLINLKTFIMQRLEEKNKNLNELRKNFKRLKEDKEQQCLFSLIKGQEAVMNRLAEANKNVKKEILGVQRNWKFWAEGIRAMEMAIKRGVKVKFIGVINKETIKKAIEWKNIGCKIRVYNKKFGENPLRFSVFDSMYARITLGKPEIKDTKDYITIWSDSRPLVLMLKNQFNEMWKDSIPIDKYIASF